MKPTILLVRIMMFMMALALPSLAAAVDPLTINMGSLNYGVVGKAYSMTMNANGGKLLYTGGCPQGHFPPGSLSVARVSSAALPQQSALALSPYR
jgi:hypothetical protein